MIQEPVAALVDANRILQDVLAKHGYKVRVRNGPLKKDWIIVAGQKKKISKYNSILKFDLRGQNFLRFELCTEDDVVHAFQASRFEDLGKMSLGDHLVEQVTRLHIDDEQPGIPETDVTNPATKKISGRTVYHGELLIGPPARKNKEILEAFCGIALFISYLKWRPDFTWCVLRQKQVRQAVAMRFWMCHQSPYLMVWKSVPDFRFQNDWIGYNDEESILYLADMISNHGLIADKT